MHAADAGLDVEALRAECAEAGQLQGQWAELQSMAKQVRGGLKGMMEEQAQAAAAQVRCNIKSTPAVPADDGIDMESRRVTLHALHRACCRCAGR